MTDLRSDLQGLTTPVVTPFDGADIDWDAYAHLLDHLVDGGVDAVFPCGTTGEFASLTHTERRQLVERTVDATPDDVRVLVGGTGTSVGETAAWLDTAADLGVDGAVVTAPYFHTSNAPEGLRRFFVDVAESSPLPLVLYNIPACVGETIPAKTVAAVATHESIVGVKDSSGDLGYGLRVSNLVPDEVLMLQGYDPLLLPSLRMEFDGGVNALSNVIPSAYAELLADPASDRAEELHRQAIEPLFELCREEGFAPAAKAALSERSVIPSNEVRPPLVAVAGEDATEAVDRAESALDRV